MKATLFPRPARGFSLVEVTLALGVATFCLVAILGMLPVGLTSKQNAAAQTGAVSVMRAVAADLGAAPVASAPSTTATSPYFGLQVPNSSGATIYVDEGGSVIPKAQARYAVFVQTVSTASATSRSATQERVLITWPPQAATASGSMDSIISLDRN